MHSNQLQGFNAIPAAPTVTWLSGFLDGAGNPRTGSIDLGATSGLKKIVINIGAQAGSITTVTLGGEACTAVVALVTDGSRGVALYECNTLLTGSQTVSITFGTDPGITINCGAWRIDGLHCYTAYDTLSVSGGGADVGELTGTIDVPAYGIVMASTMVGDAAPGTVTWTGVSENYDATGTQLGYSGGSIAGLAAEVGRTITADYSVTISDSALAAVSYA